MSATSIAISKNQLKYIANDAGQPFAPGATLTFLTGETSKVSPSITNGAIYFATKDNNEESTIQINDTNVTIGHNRAYIFLDDNNKRYAVTGPVDWSEILNKPLDQILSDLTMSSVSGEEHDLQLHYLDDVTDLSHKLSLPFVLRSGDSITGALNTSAHIYLTGATGLSTANTSQIIFGTSDNNHVAISSNQNALVINPSSDSTESQIVLYLTQQSSFPQGINAGTSNINAANFIGLASNATADGSGNIITSTYFADASISGRTLTFNYANNEAHSPTISLPFVLKTGDTMTDTLSIARNADENSPKVSLDYNDTTDSLDFTFT